MMLYKHALFVGFALSLLGLARAAPTAMWPDDCSNVSSNFAVPATGGSFESTGCKFPNPLINITFADAMPLNVMASVIIAGGSVGPGGLSGLGVVGPSYSAADMMGPLRITISAVSFARDAVLRFTGALPHNSTLVISANTFYQTSYNSNVGNSVVSAIWIGDVYTPILLAAASKIVVALNTFQADVTAAYAAINILIGNLTIVDDSSVVIYQNALLNSSTSSPSVAVVNWANTARLFIANHSSISINRNSINATTMVEPSPYMTSVNLVNLQTAAVQLSSRSFIDISSNYVDASTIRSQVSGLGSTVVGWGASGYVALSDASYITVFENAITNSEVGRFDLFAWWMNDATGITLTSGSAVIVQNNRANNVTAQGAFTVVSVTPGGSTLTITSGASFATMGNIVSNSTFSLGVQVISWYWNTVTVTATAKSGLLAYDNSVRSSNVVGPVAVVTFNIASGTISLASSAYTVVSNNSLFNVSCQSQSVTCSVSLNVGTMDITDRATVIISANGVANSTLQTGGYYGSRVQVANAIQIASGSTVSFSDNYARNSNISGGPLYLVDWVYSFNAAAITDSSLLMNGNVVEGTTVTQTMVLCSWEFAYNTMALHNTTVNASNNVIRNSTSVTSAYIVSWSSTTFGSTLNVSGASVVTVSNNTIIDVIVPAPAAVSLIVLTVYYLTICQDSSFLVLSSTILNPITNRVVAASYVCDGLLSVLDSSTLSFSDNNITVTSAAVYLEFFIASQGIALGGNLVVEGNTAQAPPEYGYFVFAIIYAQVFNLVPGTAADGTATSGGTVYVCRNSFSGEGGVYVAQPYLSPNSLSSAASQKYCTSDPITYNSNPPAFPIVAVVGGVAGVAVVAGGIAFFIRRRRQSHYSPPLMEQERSGVTNNY